MTFRQACVDELLVFPCLPFRWLKTPMKTKPKWNKLTHPIVGNYYVWGDLKLIVAAPEAEGGWHVSISLTHSIHA